MKQNSYYRKSKNKYAKDINKYIYNLCDSSYKLKKKII